MQLQEVHPIDRERLQQRVDEGVELGDNAGWAQLSQSKARQLCEPGQVYFRTAMARIGMLMASFRGLTCELWMVTREKRCCMIPSMASTRVVTALAAVVTLPGIKAGGSSGRRVEKEWLRGHIAVHATIEARTPCRHASCPALLFWPHVAPPFPCRCRA